MKVDKTPPQGLRGHGGTGEHAASDILLVALAGQLDYVHGLLRPSFGGHRPCSASGASSSITMEPLSVEPSLSIR